MNDCSTTACPGWRENIPACTLGTCCQCSREANPKQKSCWDGQTSAKHGHCSHSPTAGCQWGWESWAWLGHTPSAPQPSLQALLEGFQCLERAKLKLFQGKRNTKPCLQINPQTSTLNKPLLQPPLPNPAPALQHRLPVELFQGALQPSASMSTAEGNK